MAGIGCLVILVVVSRSLFGRNLLTFGPEFHPGTQIVARTNKNVDINSVVNKLKTQFPDMTVTYQKMNALSVRGAVRSHQNYLLTLDRTLYMVHKAVVNPMPDMTVTDAMLSKQHNGGISSESSPENTERESEMKQTKKELLKADVSITATDFVGTLTPETLRSILSQFDVEILNIDSISSKLSGRNTIIGLSVILISFLSISFYMLFFQRAIDRMLPAPPIRPDQIKIIKNTMPPSTTWTSFGIVVAVIHDILIMLLFCWILSIEISFPVIAAILTMIGYSVNDSVVLWSHIQNLFQKSYPPESEQDAVNIVSKSIDNVFSRTILTSLTTIIPAISILIAGIAALTDFALVICVGVVSGTLSSIFIVGSFSVQSLSSHLFVQKTSVPTSGSGRTGLSAEEFDEKMNF